MPFIDFNTNFETNVSTYDYTIIGAGAAGIFLSLLLAKQHKKVLIIETGHYTEDEQRQDLNIILQTAKNLTTSVWGRKRAIGGTTTRWGGQSLPFDEHVFTKKDWIKESGWPISYTDLKDHYNDANRFMKIDTLNYREDIFKLFKTEKLFPGDEVFDQHFSKFASEPNFRKLYAKDLDKYVTVLYNSVVTKINSSSENVIDKVRVTNFNKQEKWLNVQKLILAGGTIESVRLLLASNESQPQGLGGNSGWLGKAFMEHPCIPVGSIATNANFKLQSIFNTKIHKGNKFSVRFSLSENIQEKHKLVNASLSMMFYYKNEELDPYIEVKKVVQNKNLKGFSNILKNTPAYLKTLFAYSTRKFIYKHKAAGRAVLMLEQEPLENSTITLSDEKDKLGMPKATLNWKISRVTWETAVFISNYFKKELENSSLGTMQLEDYMTMANDKWEDYLSDVSHHMGGARMSENSSNGVVDKNLKVWGIDNLYLCSCAVFPTSSHSNPTLTLLALTSRLANHLLQTEK